jgi:copper(I)-binding protein
MKRTIFVVWVAAALALATCASGQGTSKRGITITDAWARTSPMMDRAGVAYMVLQNNSSVDDQLLSAQSDIAKTIELHETKQAGDMMEMSPVSNIPIPGNGKAELKPGGMHMMLIGLNRELKAGDKINFTLFFQKAGQVPITVEVRDQ